MGFNFLVSTASVLLMALLSSCGGGSTEGGISGTGVSGGGGDLGLDFASNAPMYTMLLTSPNGSLLPTISIAANTSVAPKIRMPTTTGTANVVVQIQGCSSATRCESNRIEFDTIELTSTAPASLRSSGSSNPELLLEIGSAAAGQTITLAVFLRGTELRSTTFTIQ